MGRAGSRDEMVEVLIVGIGGVGPIRQLMVGLVQNDSCVVLIGRENEDVEVGTERTECTFFGFGEVGLLWKGGWKFGIRDVS